MADGALTLPRFELSSYRDLLERLLANGWRLQPVSALRAVPSRTVHLRHDVDFHLDGVLRMASLEAELGARATYYVLVTGHYNVLHPDNRAILQELRALGHEVGLHYDLTTYPDDEPAAAAHLEWECSLLEQVVGAEVTTICMHQPSLGGDRFRDGHGRVHPHDPGLQAGLLYVSDSCRGWRDRSLLRAFGADAPSRILLNTHPEVWLDGAIEDRLGYLDDVVATNMTAAARRYLREEVRPLWQERAGLLQPQEPDKRS